MSEASRKKRLESETTYRGIFNALAEAVYLQDAEGRFLDVNDGAVRMYGYPRERFIGNTPEFLAAPGRNDLAAVARQVKAAFEGEPQQFEFWGIDANGREFPKDVRLYPGDYFGRRAVIAIARDTSEQREADARLAASEKKLRSVVEGLPVPTAISHAGNGEILYANTYLTSMFGMQESEAVGQKAEAFYFDPADRQLIAERLRQTGRLEGYEVRLRKGDGTPFWVETSLQPIEYDGQPAWLTVLHDIDERKRLDEMIRNSEMKYRSLFDHMLDGFAHCRMLFDGDGRPVDFVYLDVNQRFEALTGLRDVVGKPVSEVIPGIRESNPELFEIYGRVAAGGEPEWFEMHVAPLGIWLAISVYSPQPGHFAAVFDNISERKLAEMRMREESEFRRVLIEAAAEGICMWRMIDTFPYVEFAVWNRRMQEITGYTMPEINAHGWYQTLYPTSEAQAGARERMATVAEGGSIHGFEVEVITRSGQERVLRISSVPVTLEGGQTWVLAIMEDVTEHRELESNYRQMQKIEALGTLVGGIAHDFNNILAGMLGNIYLAQTFAENRPQVIEKLEIAEALGFQAADRISQLLTFARKGQVNMQPLDLNGYLMESFKRGLLSLPENIHLQREFGDDVLPVRGDATQIQQVLMNLLSNAGDALEGRQDPSVTVRLGRYVPDSHFRSAHPDLKADVFALLSIEDNGTGIQPQAIERIFEPFFTTKEVGKGTGLGLATVYSIVQGHGGVLEVESVPDMGTMFHVYLPLIDAGQLRTVARETPRAVHGNGELILVADDEPDLRTSIAEVLRRLNYHVMLAADGKEALELFRQQPDDIALVILDVVMPKMSGPETARQMRETRPTLPVIFATGYDAGHALPVVDNASPGNVLTKPFRIHALAAKIHELLAGR